MKKINEIPGYLKEHADRIAAKLAFNPKLQKLYLNCFMNAYETTYMKMDDGTAFFFTGDIHAMWNRDSAQQVTPYLSCAKESEEARDLIKGTVRRQLMNLRNDPYANAFNMEANDRHWDVRDMPRLSPWSWEQKYETDSISNPILLACRYFEITGDASLFDDDFVRTMEIVVNQFILEQNHTEKSAYTHSRVDCPWQDTLQNGGKGYPVKYTGMTWQGFRPSDDAAKFGYNIPGNMMVTVALGALLKLQESLNLFDKTFAGKIASLKEEIEHGIEDFGIYLHPKYGRIYAYETDGFGNYVLSDDANVPNLLSAPYLGFADAEDEVYKNTRAFVLSKDNPFYAEGKAARGLGSPHTPKDYVWHMGLCMQGMTASTKEEALEILDMLVGSDAGTGFMHEGFHADNPDEFTRSWFAASNSMFAEFVEYLIEKEIL